MSVARKTDAALWPALFAAVGSPLRLCQGLMRADQLQASGDKPLPGRVGSWNMCDSLACARG